MLGGPHPLRLGQALLLCLLLSACGDDAPPAPPPTFDAAPLDTGGGDAGTDSGRDTGPADTGTPMDGEVPTDTGAPPADGGGGEDAGTGPTCAVVDVLDLGGDATSMERRVDVAAGATTFLVTWADQIAGNDVSARTIPNTGAPPDAVPVPMTGGGRSPAASPNGSGWVLGYVDNGVGTYETLTASLSAALAASAPSRVTTNTVLESDVGIAAVPAGHVLAWLENDIAGTRARTVRATGLSAAGVPGGSIVAVSEAGSDPQAVAVAPWGTGAAAAWIDTEGTATHARVRRLTAAGATAGAVVTVSTEGNVAGAVDLADGAAVFGVVVGSTRKEVRFRSLGADLTPAASERRVEEATEQGSGGSIARFRGGYAIAYRSLAGSSASIRVAIADSLGNVVARFDVSDAEAGGGPTRIAASNDGTTLAIGWADSTGGGTTTHLGRLRCD